MPAITALQRLISYYESQQFADDLAHQITRNPGGAKIYRQRIVDKLNERLRMENVAISHETSKEQKRFIEGDMPIEEIISLGRVFALRWTRFQDF